MQKQGQVSTLYKTSDNTYSPELAFINGIIKLTEREMLFELRFVDGEIHKEFQYRSGQFAMLSVFGVGEAPFSFSSSPSRPGYLEFCVRRAGNVTGALHRMQPGDLVGLRGPFGNGFPVEEMRNKDLLLIAGGVGLPPLRSLIVNVHDHRSDFGRLIILYGARNPHELLFTGQLNYWSEREDMEVLLTVDEPEGKWQGRIGPVETLLSEIEIEAERTLAIACGPNEMYSSLGQELVGRGFPKGQIFVSLERKMSCGVGKCGHCAVGSKRICTDGPVLTWWDVLNLDENI